MPRHAYVTAVSQLYHGELATLAMCRHLKDRVSTLADREALEGQIADEQRHIDIYRDYLERVGDIAPPEPALQAALDGRYVWQGSPLGTIVAVHLLLEGEGLRVQNDYGHWFPCRLLKSIHGSISPDEARHISFGRRLVAREIGTLSQEERIAIYRWLEALWREGARASQADLPALIRVSMGRRWMDERWARHERVLIRTGLVSEDETRRAA
ncbi:MAG: ferritin-like domain-containing protein [Rhodospirillaceae bacterium]|nr:ferritin-like domain-containing protein [Rhodospirillaceae bacterium]